MNMMYKSISSWADSPTFPIAPVVALPTTQQTIRSNDFDSPFFRRLEHLGILLNQQQVQAIRYNRGPLLIQAGAGTGKTTCLAAKVAYLHQVHSVPLSRLLLVTFTRRAAAEINQRIAAILDIMAESVGATTFHSFCLRLLRRNGYHKHRIVTSDAERTSIMRRLLYSLALDEAIAMEDAFGMLHGQNCCAGTDPDQIANLNYAAGAYRQYLADKKLLDFDIMQLEALDLLTTNQLIRQRIQSEFDYLLIDEYQDTNRVQADLIKLLAAPENHVCAVGDPRQTIYGFRGSDIRTMADFPKYYPGAAAISLTLNYRSGASIVGLGNAVMNDVDYAIPLQATHGTGSFPLYLAASDVNEEAEKVFSSIQQEHSSGANLSKMVVLYRSTAASRCLLEKLLSTEIPVVMIGTKELIYNHPTVQPIMAFLRLALVPDDKPALLVVLPIFDMQKAQMNSRLLSTGLAGLLSLPSLDVDTAEQLQRWVLLLSRLPSLPPSEAVQQIRMAGYDRYLGLDNRDNSSEVSSIMDEFEACADKYTSISPFLLAINKLQRRVKAMKAIENDPSIDALRLMSIHAAKGLEFDTVFLIGCCEGILPHSQSLDPPPWMTVEEALEEERRLLYVAITRAKRQLYISHPAVLNGRTTNASRFLREAFLHTSDATTQRR